VCFHASVTDNHALAAEAAAIWERKAAFWADFMGPDGNGLFRNLIAPAQLRLLELQAGDAVLDLCCGGGQFSRVMAANVAHVTGFDISPTFIARCKEEAAKAGLSNTEYRVVDATDEAALRALGGPFDAAACAMAIMDLPVIEPLMRGTYALLRPGGRFVFTVMHPAFWSTRTRMVEELFDEPEGERIERAIKVTAYLHVPVEKGTGVRGEPEPHFYFHRPIGWLLAACFEAGFVLDGIEEPTFAGGGEAVKAFDWAAGYTQFPPLLVCRLRKLPE
jgi:SAM-dependent methyltransferase